MCNLSVCLYRGIIMVTMGLLCFPFYTMIVHNKIIIEKKMYIYPKRPKLILKLILSLNESRTVPPPPAFFGVVGHFIYIYIL